MKCLADDDFDGAMQAFELDDVVGRIESTVKARLNDPGTTTGSAAPSKARALARVAAINVTAELAKATRAFVYGLLLDEKQANELTEASDANIAAFIRAADPGRLKAMQIVRIDPPLPSRMNSAEGIALAKQQAQRVGADERTERIALFQLDGGYHLGGFTLLRYGNAWRISQLESVYGGTSLQGMDPVPGTTPKAYAELVK